MATSHPFETPIEGDVDVDEAVKQILAEMEAEEQDPLEGMGNAQIAEIYHRMKPEDQACLGSSRGSINVIMKPTGMMPQATS